jgi:SAM-dependent methyltransferase
MKRLVRKSGIMIDYGLMVYQKVFRLEALHLGLWEDGDSRDLDGFRKAQERYTDLLLSYIPDGVRSIIDVGCGTGATSLKLKGRDYAVSCLSPDEYQYELFKSRGIADIAFHPVKFEQLDTGARFDLALFSESFQYLDTEKAFAKCRSILQPGGYVLASDYFRKTDTRYYRTCKVNEEFLSAARANGYVLAKAEDITERTLPTLTLGRELFERYGLPLADVLKTLAARKYPLVSRVLYRLFKKKIDKVGSYIYEHTPDKLDAEKFRRNMNYMIYLFKRV